MVCYYFNKKVDKAMTDEDIDAAARLLVDLSSDRIGHRKACNGLTRQKLQKCPWVRPSHIFIHNTLQKSCQSDSVAAGSSGDGHIVLVEDVRMNYSHVRRRRVNNKIRLGVKERSIVGHGGKRQLTRVSVKSVRKTSVAVKK